MKLSINEKEVEKIESFGHWGKPLIWEKTVGTKTGFEVGVGCYDATEFPETKTHDDEEAIFIIKGKGIAKIGEEEVELSEGVAIYVPAGVPHCIKRTGEGELKAVYCHSGQKGE